MVDRRVAQNGQFLHRSALTDGYCERLSGKERQHTLKVKKKHF